MLKKRQFVTYVAHSGAGQTIVARVETVHWRDSYDAWKLATPPEYEMTDEEEERRERDEIEDRIDALMQEEQTDETTAEVVRLQVRLDSEPCPNCSVEWADQYLGDCDICHGKRRVQRFAYGPSEAEIARSQAMIGAVLGVDLDDEEIPF
jgi:hypothetical protein